MKLYAVLLCALVLCALTALSVGHRTFLPTELWQAWTHPDSLNGMVVRELRLPRLLAGMLVGACLGLSGAVMQGYLRNPLAEPGLLGVSSGAALGAALVLYSGLATIWMPLLPLAAIGGGALAALAVYLLAGGRGDDVRLILAGVAVSSLSAAGLALVLNLAPNPFARTEIMFWLMGALVDRSMADVLRVLPFMATGVLLLAFTARALDALALGDDTAASMGISLRRTRLWIVSGTACAVGASVALAGSIGFVGLVVPHLLRTRVGGVPSALLPVCTLGGAVLVVAADVAVRLIPTNGEELKLGVLTALVGAPFFLWLLVRERREGA